MAVGIGRGPLLLLSVVASITVEIDSTGHQSEIPISGWSLLGRSSCYLYYNLPDSYLGEMIESCQPHQSLALNDYADADTLGSWKSVCSVTRGPMVNRSIVRRRKEGKQCLFHL